MHVVAVTDYQVFCIFLSPLKQSKLRFYINTYLQYVHFFPLKQPSPKSIQRLMYLNVKLHLYLQVHFRKGI